MSKPSDVEKHLETIDYALQELDEFDFAADDMAADDFSADEIDIEESDANEIWANDDTQDIAFWDEFFRIEEVLDKQDEFFGPTFSISVQNQHTGEVKTFQNVHLSSSKTKINC